MESWLSCGRVLLEVPGLERLSQQGFLGYPHLSKVCFAVLTAKASAVPPLAEMLVVRLYAACLAPRCCLSLSERQKVSKLCCCETERESVGVCMFRAKKRP